jgi:hypothetical protein
MSLELLPMRVDVFENEAIQHKGAAMLYARRCDGLPAPFVYIKEYKPSQDFGFALLELDDLLARWPSTPSEQIDRCLINICRSSSTPGAKVTFHHQEENAFLFLSTDSTQWSWFAHTLVNQDCIERLSSPANTFTVTANGWERFNLLTRDTNNRANPTFVAMWFGGDEPTRRSNQDDLFAEISKVCQRAGWLAGRPDGMEHNDSIIDKIIFMIRQSPFVIADLSDENHGAYFEAGFAKGLGREVIYLVKEGSRVHFDLSGMNQVRWGNFDELRAKLENRILGTKGRGPHKFEEQK